MTSTHPSPSSYRWQTPVSSRAAIRTLAVVFGALVVARLLPPAPPGHEAALEHVARALPLWTGLPFAGMLLSIALFPLLAPHFWHLHYKKVAVAWAFVFFGPFFVQYGILAAIRLVEVLLIDYVPFLILLWGLYTVSGGIYLRATLVATPALNAAFLVAGLVLASLMGTTGASMLLVRPMLRANGWRKHKAHVFVFFIFLVSNLGGLLTPLGDPPLFLGFIHGVPFFWTLRLFPEYLFVSAIVLAVFVVLDMRLIRREIESRPTHEPPHRRTSFRVEGAHNFLLLFGILGAVLLSGILALFRARMVRRALRAPQRRARPAHRRGRPRVDRLDAEGGPRGQRVHVGAHEGGGVPLLRHLRHDHPGAHDPQGRRRRGLPGSSSWASPHRGSTSGRRACCRVSWTTHRPT